jgi:hypothetical protein
MFFSNPACIMGNKGTGKAEYTSIDPMHNKSKQKSYLIQSIMPKLWKGRKEMFWKHILRFDQSSMRYICEEVHIW